MNFRPRGAARSARLPVTQEIVGSNPIGDAKTARYANRQSDEAQTFMIVQVRLLPASLNQICVGWALASLSGRNPPAFGLWRFDSVPTHFLWRGAMLVLAASLSSSPTRVQFPSASLFPFRLGVMLVVTARPSTWPTRVRFPSESLEHSQVVERNTRDAQNVVPKWACEFDSRLGYFLDCRCGRCPVGFHKPDEPGSIPGPATGLTELTRVGQRSFGLHKPGPPGATPGPATGDDRVRKLAKRSR